jgi:hypothetical protein
MADNISVMRHIQLLILSLSLFITANSQDSTWTKRVVNDILILDLPTNHEFEEQDLFKRYTGSIGEAYFNISYHDSSMKVSSEEHFRISLTGLAHGITTQVPQNEYQIYLGDTAIGNTRGIFIKFAANANATYPNDIVSYVTIANSHFYAFTVSIPASSKDVTLKSHFFNMIRFDASKVRETSYPPGPILMK